MALEKVSFSCEYINWTDEMIGHHLKFFYLKTEKSVNSQFNSLTHYVKSADTGKIFGLSGNGNLNWFINKTLGEAGKPRFYFEMVYKGRDEAKASQFFGKAPYSFDYWVDLARFDPAIGGEEGEVEYKNSGATDTTETAAPALVKPEQSQPVAVQPEPQAPAAQAAPQPEQSTPQKNRKILVVNEAEILTKALEAQSANGPKALVEVLIDRLPNSRYVKQLQLRPKQGPWGRIVALTPDGTLVCFEVHRLITFLCAIGIKQDDTKRTLQSRTDRVKIHPFISRYNAEKIKEISLAKKLSVSAAIDSAINEFIQRYA